MDTLAPNEPFRFSAAAPPRAAASGEDLVNETRREIQQLVREASELVGNAEDPQLFWPAFLDRVWRATAADAVALWTFESDGPIVDHRVGRRWDEDWTAIQTGCHKRLIDDVAARAEPVLVPPTATDEDSDVPSNPTESLAVLVPILVDDRTEAMLEVLMPTGGGPATQRGYLRFTAQMGDLAGEYLRNDVLRRTREDREAWSQLSACQATLHESLDQGNVAATIVDAAAAAMRIDRASLVIRKGKRWGVVAISGVPEFDDRSPTVKALGEHVRMREQMPHDDDWRVEAIGDDEDVLPVVGRLPVGEDARLLLQSTGAATTASDRQRWRTFASHARIAWENADRFASVPFADLQAKVFTAAGRVDRSRRPFWIAAVAAIVLGLIGLVPVPMVVTAKGDLESVDRQIVYAPRDAVVTEIAVEHGDLVQAGDVLLRLVDDDLDREMDDLVGQQNVLEQRRRELRSLMVSMAGANADEAERIEGDFKLVSQQIEGVEQQMALLSKQRDKLCLRAARDGRVNAWRIKQQLTDRPVARSQELLRVVDPAGRWRISAAIPQRRMDHVLGATDGGSAASAEIAFSAFPGKPITGSVGRVAMAAGASDETEPMGHAEIEVDTASLPIHESGAQATVAIDCGRRPLAYVALQDLIRTVRSAVGIYL